MRRDVGAGSTVGATVTTFDQGAEFNRVVAADARILFGKLYFVEAQAGGPWSGDGSGKTPAPITGTTLAPSRPPWRLTPVTPVAPTRSHA